MSTRFKCPKCPRAFPILADVAYHLRTFHTSYKLQKERRKEDDSPSRNTMDITDAVFALADTVSDIIDSGSSDIGSSDGRDFGGGGSGGSWE